jgi:hypothetical protein
MMTELSPPDFPKALPVILCQVCDICLDNECSRTSQPIEPKAIVTSSGGGCGAAIGVAPFAPAARPSWLWSWPSRKSADSRQVLRADGGLSPARI